MAGTVEELVANTVGALRVLDAEALEVLAAQAERMACAPEQPEGRSVAGTPAVYRASRTLAALLASTDRSLRMLRGLRGVRGGSGDQPWSR